MIRTQVGEEDFKCTVCWSPSGGSCNCCSWFTSYVSQLAPHKQYTVETLHSYSSALLQIQWGPKGPKMLPLLQQRGIIMDGPYQAVKQPLVTFQLGALSYLDTRSSKCALSIAKKFSSWCCGHLSIYYSFVCNVSFVNSHLISFYNIFIFFSFSEVRYW